MIAILVSLFVGLACGFVCAQIGRSKQIGGLNFIKGLLLGPIGILWLMALPVNEQGLRKSKLSSGRYRACPVCKELVLSKALICKHCQTQLTPSVSPSVNVESQGDFQINSKRIAVLAVLLISFVAFVALAMYFSA